MKNIFIPALALLVGVSAMAPTVQAASGPVTKQELRKYTQQCQRIRDAAQKCAAIRMKTVYLGGSGKTSETMLSSKQTEDIRRIFSTGLQPFQGSHNIYAKPGYIATLYFLDENGKVLGSIRNIEVCQADSKLIDTLVMFTLPEEDYKLYSSIIGE